MLQDRTYTIGQSGSETFITVLNELQEVRLTGIYEEERFYLLLSQIDELIGVLQKLKQQGE